MKNKIHLKNESKCPGLRCPDRVEILTYFRVRSVFNLRDALPRTLIHIFETGLY